MNCENNYLRIFSESQWLGYIQQFVKKYSKGLSLLVKINKSAKKTYQFSLKILEFLFRMQLSSGLKSYLIYKFTKKDKFQMSKFVDMCKQQFHRVSFPTFVLYFSVIIFQS
mmetsp:Transcript_35973/g.55267  ORF Transcript_35973/g.55267 Transcript_35973/m.55267 type:complete len:111 (+) Transcript_35973:1487-1819(+)